MSGSEGFYLGCKWISSAKDIPVPEEVKEGWEKLLHSARVENEEKRQNILAQWRLQWQKEEFRRMQGNVLKKNSTGGLLSEGAGCQCTSCGILVITEILGGGCLNPEPDKYCAYCVNSDGSVTEFTFSSEQARDSWVSEQKSVCGCGPPVYPDCGVMEYTITSVSSGNYRCCGIWPSPRCDGTVNQVEWDCGLKCKQEICGDESCVRLQGTERRSCQKGAAAYYDCSNCCNNPCDPPRCGAPCLEPVPSCKQYSTQEVTTTEQCVCL